MNVSTLQHFIIDYSSPLVFVFFFGLFVGRYLRVKNRLREKDITTKIVESTIELIIIKLQRSLVFDYNRVSNNMKWCYAKSLFSMLDNREATKIYLMKSKIIDRLDMVFSPKILLPGIFLISIIPFTLIIHFVDSEYKINIAIIISITGVIIWILEELTYSYFIKIKKTIDNLPKMPEDKTDN